MASGISLFSQEGNNPFLISGGASNDSTYSKSDALSENPFDLNSRNDLQGNPFELSIPNENQGIQDASAPVLVETPKERRAVNFQFLFFSGLLVFLTVLFTLFRSAISSFNKALWNDNILKLLHRQRLVWKASTTLWYLFFFLNLAIFISQWMKHGDPSVNLAGLTFKLSLLVLGLSLLKHLIISTIGGLFPLSKECSLYNFTIIVFAINLGLFLLPFNLLISFGPLEIRPWIFYLAALIIVLLLAYRSLRALLQTSRLWMENKFHFFLYLCTVEIAPVFVLLKAVLG